VTNALAVARNNEIQHILQYSYDDRYFFILSFVCDLEFEFTTGIYSCCLYALSLGIVL